MAALVCALVLMASAPGPTAGAAWSVYTDREQGFELRYPDSLLSVTKIGRTVLFEHAIPFEHVDPCDFDDDVATLSNLVDFSVAIELWRQGLGETVESTATDFVTTRFLKDGKLQVNPGFIDEVCIGARDGFRVTSGVEGCGQSEYYIPIDSCVTLYVRRKFITEFDPILRDYERHLALPGIIAPKKEGEILEEMIASFDLLP
jgi:hypothetical protein